MEGTYDVMLGASKMGTVTLQKCGLYQHFSCRCQLSGDVMLELIMTQDENVNNLGLMMPLGGSFGFDIKLPAKRFGQGAPTFSLRPRTRQKQAIFVPLRPEEPFGYLQQLENAYLCRNGDELGLVLQEEK